MNTRLLEMPICVQISEPWDFEVPGRGTMIEGLTGGICLGPAERNWQGKYLLVSAFQEFSWKGETVRQLLLSPRYTGDRIEDIRTGKKMIMGIARVKPGTFLKTSTPFSKEDVDYFAIGSAQIVKGKPGRTVPS